MRRSSVDYKGFFRGLGVKEVRPNYRRVKQRRVDPNLVEESVITGLTGFVFNYPPGKFEFYLEVNSGRLNRHLSPYELNNPESPITPEEIEKVSSVARQHSIAFDVEKAKWKVDEKSLHERGGISIISL